MHSRVTAQLALFAAHIGDSIRSHVQFVASPRHKFCDHDASHHAGGSKRHAGRTRVSQYDTVKLASSAKPAKDQRIAQEALDFVKRAHGRAVNELADAKTKAEEIANFPAVPAADINITYSSLPVGNCVFVPNFPL